MKTVQVHLITGATLGLEVMTSLFQHRVTNFENFPASLKGSTKLCLCRKFNTGMSIYSRDTLDRIRILYI